MKPMIKEKIHNKTIENLSNASVYGFPKYTTQLVNLVNQNAGGTRPKVVGQMSELINEFPGRTLEEWRIWYDEKQPDAIENATDKIYQKFQEMRDAVDLIDRRLIKEWVMDLVYTKTFCGLKFQAAILRHLSEKMDKPWRLANVAEEARGIDGYIGEVPVQIKAATYKNEKSLGETINCTIVYYEKKKDGLNIEYEPADF